MIDHTAGIMQLNKQAQIPPLVRRLGVLLSAKGGHFGFIKSRALPPDAF